jgi:4-diphosphocytidyl-2-C-methyl-D-erythritol kinase
MIRLRAAAPAKINLGLFVGPRRPSDQRHELVTVMQSISLADDLVLEPAGDGADGDEVICPGVPAPDLAARAVGAFREATGWDAPPVRLTVAKRVPIAAGLGGGSGDAAAALRLCARAAGCGDTQLLLDIAAELGADVPAQVRPGRVLATGAGEVLEHLPEPPPFGVLVLPNAQGLSTAAVYEQTDSLGIMRPPADLAALRARVREYALAGQEPDHDMLVNDLSPAARMLHRGIDEALRAARDSGAAHAFVTGSGPTVIAFFPGYDGPGHAALAAAALAEREPPAFAARPVGPDCGEPVELEG